MNKFENNLKTIAKQNINIPSEYEKSVKDALKYISNMDNTSNKKEKVKIKKIFTNHLSKVAAIIIMFSIGLTVYANISGNLNLQGLGLNKLNNNYEENKVDINKVIENDYLKLSIKNIARDSAYIILEYNLELKEKAMNEIGEITYSEMQEYSIWLDCNISLNEDKSSFYLTHLEKISEKEYTYYQIIYAMTEDSEKNNLKIWYKSLINNNSGTEIQINEMLEISSKIENNEDTFVKEEQKLSDGSTLVLDKILNTNFQTFAIVKRIIENVSWKEYNSTQYRNTNFLVTDTENNVIPYLTYTSDIIGNTYYLSSGEKINIKTYNIKDNDIIKVVENYVILMDEVSEGEEINVVPYKLLLYNDRTNEEREMYDKAKWYNLEEGTKTYTAKSTLGGTLEINKIEIDDENITFYYNKNGIVENNAGYVIIRKNNGVMNYIGGTKQDIGNQGTIIFARDQFGTSGLIGWKDSPDEYYKMLENLEDLQFTMLFGHTCEYDGKAFETKIPKFSNQKLEIDNISQYKTEMVIINVENNEEDYKYIINYDKDGNILETTGNFDLFYYKTDTETKYIRPREFTKVDELVNKMKQHIEYKKLKYTIKYE